MNTPSPAEEQAAAPLGQLDSWRCFHCGFVAKTRDEAEIHFGKRHDSDRPACQAISHIMGLSYLKRAEAAEASVSALNTRIAQLEGQVAALSEHIECGWVSRPRAAGYECNFCNGRADDPNAKFPHDADCPVLNVATSAQAHLAELRNAALAQESLTALRSAGWMVAVHNDYRMNGKLMTFWLFTKDGIAIKGEGATDAEALAAVTTALKSTQEPTQS